MKALQAVCAVGAMTFTGMIYQFGGNTPAATAPDTMPEATASVAMSAAPALSAAVSAIPDESISPGAELASVPGALSRPSLMTKADIGDDFETRWADLGRVDLGHHDAAEPAERPHDASDGASSPASGTHDFRYLIYYVWNELPPAEKPAEIVLRSMKDIPAGTVIDEIKRASDAFGLDFTFMKAVARIESGFDPNQRTGSYIGLFQLSNYEFGKFGSGKILDARDNAVAAAYKFITEGILFQWMTHKKPTLSDLYLIHQQGWEGAAEHIKQPDRIAWKSMCATSEGMEKGERWCKRAIWRNTLPAVKHAWKSVDKLTSGAFVGMWRDRVAELYSKYTATAAAEPAKP